MERINPQFFYQLGALLKPLTEMQAEHTWRGQNMSFELESSGELKHVVEEYRVIRKKLI